MIVAGWRTSLVDAPGVALVVWVCGCNLKCPFCHNWAVAEADPRVCKEVDVPTLVEKIREYSAYIDYVQISGGEPLLYADEVREVFAKIRGDGPRTSLNSNLTLPGRLATVADLADHVATDIKIPQFMYGVDEWRSVFSSFLESLRLLVELNPRVDLELRIPVARLPAEYYAEVLEPVGEAIGSRARCRVVVQRVYGRPIVVPRSDEWCRTFCIGDAEYASLAFEVKHLAKQYLTACREVVVTRR